MKRSDSESDGKGEEKNYDDGEALMCEETVVMVIYGDSDCDGSKWKRR